MKFGGIDLKEGTFGGYELVNKPASSLPQDLATAFSKVNSKLLGATYEPIWYVGHQLVNGTNHMLICKEVRITETVKPMIVALVVNVPPTKGTPVVGEGASIYTIIEKAELSPELDTIFKAGVTNLVGVGYKPIAYVGKQVVKGVNYFFVCEARPIVPNATPYAVMLGINVFENQTSVVVIEPLETTKAGMLGYAFTW